MQNINLDFDNIKRSFIEQLKTDDVFVDYNHEGHNFNILINLLARYMQYTGMYNAVTLNELNANNCLTEESLYKHAYNKGIVPIKRRSSRIKTIGYVTTLIPEYTQYATNKNGSVVVTKCTVLETLPTKYKVSLEIVSGTVTNFTGSTIISNDIDISTIKLDGLSNPFDYIDYPDVTITALPTGYKLYHPSLTSFTGKYVSTNGLNDFTIDSINFNFEQLDTVKYSSGGYISITFDQLKRIVVNQESPAFKAPSTPNDVKSIINRLYPDVTVTNIVFDNGLKITFSGISDELKRVIIDDIKPYLFNGLNVYAS